MNTMDKKVIRIYIGPKMHLRATCCKRGTVKMISGREFKKLAIAGEFCRKCVPDAMIEMLVGRKH